MPSAISKVGSAVNIGKVNFYPDISKDPGSPVRFMYSEDINKDGVDEVIIAGFESQSKTPGAYSNTNVSIFGWVNGQFKNITTHWLPNGANSIEGSGDVAFGDFNGDGKKDMFFSAYTDSYLPANPYSMINKGDHFEKVSFGLTQGWQHGTAVGDINKDGFDDVYATGYNTAPAMYMGSKNDLVKYTFKGFAGGSDVVFGDFMGNGTLQAIVTDASPDGGGGTKPTKLCRMIVNSDAHTISLETISTLPSASLPHSVRVVNIDFTNDGSSDVVVFSRAWTTGDGIWPENSALQFLKNLGQGKFQDVTSTVLPNYDHNTNIAYVPVFEDFNNDGKTDIYVSEASWSNTNKTNSTALIMQQPDGTFVEMDRQWLSSSVDNGGQGGMTTIAKGPSGDYFVVGLAPQRYPIPTSDPQEIYLTTLSFKNLDGTPRATVTNTPVQPGVTVFNGKMTDYGWTVNGSTVSVEQQVFKGLDAYMTTLHNVNRIGFYDYNIAFDIGGNAGAAYRLYKAAFDREPDLGGLGYWINLLDKGMSLKEVSSGFVNSTEFHNMYGSKTNNTEFVTLLYQNVLDRTPDQGGFDWWVHKMHTDSQTYSRENVLIGFSESVENRQNVIDLIGQGIQYDPVLI